MSNHYNNIPSQMCGIIDAIDIQKPVVGKVYRVSKSGKKDGETFFNTYSEILNGTTGKNKDLNDPGTYSTSVYLVSGPCEKFVKFLAKKYRDKYPSPAVIVGNIEPDDGRAQRTIERLPHYDDPNHVDWWIYAGKESEIAERFDFY